MSDRHLAESWNGQPEYLGEFLAQIRREQGRDLREVSATLRIRLPYLQAIEQSRYDQLPGTPYAIGFLRSYAETLGLDPEQVVRRFKEEIQGRQNKANLVFPAPKPEGRIPGGALVLVSLLLIGLCYGAWELWKSRGDDLIAMLPEPSQVLRDGELDVPAATDAVEGQPAAEEEDASGSSAGVTDYVPPGSSDLASVEPATDAVPPSSTPPSSTPPSSTPPSSTPPASTPPASTSPATSADSGATAPAGGTTAPAGGSDAPPAPAATGASAAGSQTAALPPASTGAPAPAAGTGTGAAVAPAAEDEGTIPEAPTAAAPTLSPNPSGRVYGGRSDGRVILQARADSWVQVLGPSNRPVFTQLLRAGDRYVVPDESGLKLLTGNAGGLEIWIDGRPTPSLGPQGAVRRDISLDPDELRETAVN